MIQNICNKILQGRIQRHSKNCFTVHFMKYDLASHTRSPYVYDIQHVPYITWLNRQRSSPAFRMIATCHGHSIPEVLSRPQHPRGLTPNSTKKTVYVNFEEYWREICSPFNKTPNIKTFFTYHLQFERYCQYDNLIPMTNVSSELFFKTKVSFTSILQKLTIIFLKYFVRRQNSGLLWVYRHAFTINSQYRYSYQCIHSINVQSSPQGCCPVPSCNSFSRLRTNNAISFHTISF